VPSTWEKNAELWSLDSAFNYIVIYGLSDYHVFPHYLKNGTIFGKKKLSNIKRVLIFSTNVFFWNIFNFKKNSVRYYRKCVQVFMQNAYYSCKFLIKLHFSDCQKILKYNTSLKPVLWELSCSMQIHNQTDRQTDMKKLIVALHKSCECT
jgi:hypothetical protein